jgi:WD40 repeat protein
MTFEKSKLVWELKWDADWVTAVQFLGDSRRVVAGNRLGQMMEWELPGKLEDEAPQPLRQLTGHTNAITRLRCTNDGRTLYSASYDHTVRQWDTAAKSEGEAKLTLNAGAVYRRSLRRSGPKVEPTECAVAVQPNSKVMADHKEWITVMLFSADEKQLITGDDGGQVVFRDRASGKEQQRLSIDGWVHAVALSPDTKRAAISERRPLVFDSGTRRAFRLWDVAKAKSTADLSKDFSKMYLTALAWSPDGETIIVGRGEEAEGKIWLLDAKTGKKRKELSPIHRYGVTDFIFHPDGKHFLSTGRDTVIRIWNIKEGKLVKELGKPRGGQFKDWIHALDLTPDGQLLAAADMAGQVNIWHLG